MTRHEETTAPETAWCPECRTRVAVEEVADNGHQTRAGEVAYATTYLACDHTLQGPERIIAPAPGAPYAGPQAFPAATARPADVRAAAARQQAFNAPWGDGA